VHDLCLGFDTQGSKRVYERSRCCLWPTLTPTPPPPPCPPIRCTQSRPGGDRDAGDDNHVSSKAVKRTAASSPRSSSTSVSHPEPEQCDSHSHRHSPSPPPTPSNTLEGLWGQGAGSISSSGSGEGGGGECGGCGNSLQACDVFRPHASHPLTSVDLSALILPPSPTFTTPCIPSSSSLNALSTVCFPPPPAHLPITSQAPRSPRPCSCSHLTLREALGTVVGVGLVLQAAPLVAAFPCPPSHWAFPRHPVTATAEAVTTPPPASPPTVAAGLGACSAGWSIGWVGLDWGRVVTVSQQGRTPGA
jgi:hypothetical protein